jgi:hypothetical protein
MSDKSPAEQLREITKEVRATTMVRAEAQPEQYWDQIWSLAQAEAKSGKSIVSIEMDRFNLKLNHAEQEYWKRFLDTKGFFGIMVGENFTAFGWST